MTGAAVEPARPRPLPHLQEQRAPKADERHQSEHVEAAEPDAGKFIRTLGEERGADNDEEDHRPGGGEPEVLLLVAAERLHLIDIGDLECQHRQHGDRENSADIVPLEAVDRHDIAAIDRRPDQHDQREFDETHRAGEHDR